MDNLKLNTINEMIKKLRFNSCYECFDPLIVDHKIYLKCSNCLRKYCNHCWLSANDQYIKWDTDGTKRDFLGFLLIPSCDYCDYGDEEEENIEYTKKCLNYINR